MNASPWVITIYGESTFPGPGSCETVFWPVPAWRWYEGGSEGRQLAGAAVDDDLRQMSAWCAARAGRRLHHADWVITADRAQLRHIAGAGCAAGWPTVEDALSWLARNRGEVAAGVLHWLADPPEPGPPAPGN